jgi:hypothetical protein
MLYHVVSCCIMLYSIEREALLKARNNLVSSGLYRDRHCTLLLCCSQAALLGGPICKVRFPVASQFRFVATAEASFNDCW